MSSTPPTATSDKAEIWRLITEANKYAGFQAMDLRNLQAFSGAPLGGDWQPPAADVVGKSKRAADFAGWAITAPVISERAKEVLAPLFDGFVQFLPFHSIGKRRYFLVNVLSVERDLLDFEKSKIFYGTADPTFAIKLERAAFHVPRRSLPPIFKVPAPDGRVFGDVFVTGSFAAVAIEWKLSGFSLADPWEAPLECLLAGKPMNIVEGIVG